MDLFKLRAFMVVAEELNFRRSAEVLGMSQPPLTRLIAALEEELSTKLFERTTRQVRLTGAGVYLLREARQILAEAERVELEIRSIGKLRSGNLTIAFSTTTFLANLPKILDEFRDRFPKVKLELQQESRSRILRGLSKGLFDVCFLEGGVDDGRFATHLVRDEKLGVLVPAGHSLANRKEIEFRDLENETIILHPRKDNDQFFDVINQLFKRTGIKPQIYLKNERESCPILVAIGRGVSLTISNVQQYVATETRFVPIKKLYLPVSAFWNHANANPSLKCFLSFVMESASLGKPGVTCLVDVMRM